MTKNVTIRFEPAVAALVEMRAVKTGVSFNQAVQDAVIRAESLDEQVVSKVAAQHIAKYKSVLDRLA
jgi:adenosine/AMP kinase